jgi:hypothetical protein
VLGNRAPMRIFGLKGEEMRRGYRILRTENLRISYCSLRIRRGLKWRKIIWVGHVEIKGLKINKKISSQHRKVRNHLRGRGIDENIIKVDHKEMRVWTGFIWFRTGISDSLLCKWQWSLGFRKLRRISWLPSQKVLFSMELIIDTYNIIGYVLLC